MAERGDVAEAPTENARGDPAGIVQDITLLQEAVGRATSLDVIGVEPEDAAVVDRIVIGVEIGIWKEERGNIAGADVA